jgi:hypothetical protein
MKPPARPLKWLRFAVLPPLLASMAAPLADGAEPDDADVASPRFNIGVIGAAPFPTDFFTESDPAQFTGLRVSLPKPNCAARPSDCQDIDVLNTLDGFNLNPRLSIPFDADIDPTSVSSQNVFLLEIGGSQRVGINQAVWDRLSRTLYAEADLTLREATRYVLIVTTGVRDALGGPIEASGAFQAFRHGLKLGKDLTAYRTAVLAGLDRAVEAGVNVNEIAVASLFTTQSITPSLLRTREYLNTLPAPQADFSLGPGGTRTVFARSSIKGLTFRQQTRTVSGAPLTEVVILPTPADFPTLDLVPGAVGSIAYGRIETTSFLQDNLTFKGFGTRSRPPEVGTEWLYFNLYIPSGEKPAGGWPVAVIGPGANQNKETFSVLLASKLAEAGIASLGINPVGRGFGPLSKNKVTFVDETSVEFLAGGRSRDTNADTVIGSSEGADAAGPLALVGSRDTTKQTILDHVQLARAIDAGLDVDGDGSRDVDPDRIGFIGWSFGSNYGVPAVALEPAFKTAVFSAVGGPLVDNRRLGINRNLVEAQLAARVPSLDTPGPGFNDNFPLRDQPIVINSVDGAMAIQDYIDNNEWALQSSDIVPFASRLRAEPLAGSAPRAVLINIAKGDQTVPNPAASKVIRAGDLSDVTMFYRHDLAFAAKPALPKNPHQFMTLINNTAFKPISVEVEQQAAQFLATGGPEIYQPLPAIYFEMPIPLPLPETLSFIP